LGLIYRRLTDGAVLPVSRMPELSSIPKFEPSLETMYFECSNGATRQAASIKIPSMTIDEATCFFKANWPVIAGMVLRKAPTNGEVKLTLFD
jgi:hypothetical protein